MTRTPLSPLDTTRRLSRVDFDGGHGQLLGVDAAAGLDRAWAIGTILLGAEQVGGCDDSFFKWQVFKSVERVVMHEDADRPLHGKQVRGVCYSLAQPAGSRSRGLTAQNPSHADSQSCAENIRIL